MNGLWLKTLLKQAGSLMHQRKKPRNQPLRELTKLLHMPVRKMVQDHAIQRNKAGFGNYPALLIRKITIPYI